ncbi:MAG: efflux RND transporter periplasmic adaptor subunit [Rhodothermales bacterium]|nr:efflux RND transporter periplasmic adaptor subunit [Rhodothermales bacterium]MBO6780713.1 efflux RND transporter periplasmic adaptor subunit [Rhodothermales bacterium]
MKKIVAIGVVVVLSGAAIWRFTSGQGEPTTSYRFVTMERGDLEAVVTSTGNLDAVTTVQVGTQVSGRIDRLFVDFNDTVRRGQLMALIDTTLLVSAVQDARATLRRNTAQRNFAATELARIQRLADQQFATEVELNQAKYDLELAEANLESAEIAQERAERNLGYSRIYAPMSGVVIERSVEQGQTVAASMSTPQLFLLANDLSELEILASVDESDIGQIQEGQQVRFTVQAYDDETFEGRVRQVRLQSATQDNVVTYTAVVDVDNTDGRLLPGMTATVEFLVETVSDVYKVPNAALRFRPTEEMMTEFRERMMAAREAQGAPSDSTRRGGAAGQGGGQAAGAAARGGFGGGGFGAANRGMLWYLDEQGQLSAAFVRTGLSDGTMTEVQGRNIEAGMEIIAGVTITEGGSTANPFQQNNQSGGRFRGGGF